MTPPPGKPREFEEMKNSKLYKSASLTDKVKIAIDHKHFSLESGADANHELFHVLIPELLTAFDELKANNDRLKTELEFTKEYLNPVDTSFRTMIDSFKLLPKEKQDKLIALSKSLADLSESSAKYPKSTIGD